MTKVSIIVPVYNTAKYLDKCFDSILKQSLKEIELIIVNDASPYIEDDTICEKYEKLDSRVTYIKHKINKRQGGARNTALDIAKGEYVGFVDSDDYIAPKMYEIMYKKATKEGVDVVQCNSVFVDEKHKIKKDKRLKENVKKEKLYLCQDDIIKDLLSEVINGGPCNKLYKREFIEKYNIRYPENIFHEDYLFQLRYFKYSNKLLKIKETFYYVFERENSSSRLFDSFSMTSWIDSLTLMSIELKKASKTTRSEFLKFCRMRILSISYRACKNNITEELFYKMKENQFIMSNSELYYYAKIISFLYRVGVLSKIKKVKDWCKK